MWRGLKDVKMIRNGANSDPYLVYDGIVANYRTIENRLYDNFIDDLKEENRYDEYMNLNEKDSDIMFNNWLKENDYLLGEIYSQLDESEKEFYNLKNLE